MKTLRRQTIVRLGLLVAVLGGAGCAKRIRFAPLPLARAGKATARLELTYDRNNTLQIELSNVPEPSILNDQYTRYVLWVASPDRQSVVNVGQLRVDEAKKAEIRTLTPLRHFVLFITAEPRGDVMTPGPDIVFQTKEIRW